MLHMNAETVNATIISGNSVRLRKDPCIVSSNLMRHCACKEQFRIHSVLGGGLETRLSTNVTVCKIVLGVGSASPYVAYDYVSPISVFAHTHCRLGRLWADHAKHARSNPRLKQKGKWGACSKTQAEVLEMAIIRASNKEPSGWCSDGNYGNPRQSAG